MSYLPKDSEAEIYDLSKKDDEIEKRSSALQQVIALANHDRHRSLVALMLDTYKKKLETTLRKDIEAQFKRESDRKFEVDSIKKKYAVLQSERDAALMRELEEKLRKKNDELDHNKKKLAAERESKRLLELTLTKEKNKVYDLDCEKKQIVNELNSFHKDADKYQHRLSELFNKNQELEKEIRDRTSRIAELEQCQASHSVIRTEKDVLQEKLTLIEAQNQQNIAKLQQYEAHYARLQQDVNQYKSIVDDFQRVERGLRLEIDHKQAIADEFKTLLADVHRHNSELKEKNIELSSELSEREEYIKALLSDKQTFDSRIDMYEKQIEEAKKEKGNIYSILKHKEEALQDVLNDFEEYKDDTRQSLQKLNDENTLIRRTLEDAYVQLDDKDNKYRTLENDTAHLLQQKNDLVLDKNDLQNKCETLANSFDRERARLTDEIHRLATEVQRLKDHIKERQDQLSSVENTIVHMKAEREALEKMHRESDAELRALRSELAEASKANHALSEALAHMEQQGEKDIWEKDFLKEHIKELNQKQTHAREVLNEEISGKNQQLKRQEQKIAELERSLCSIQKEYELNQVVSIELREKVEDIKKEKKGIEDRLIDAEKIYSTQIRLLEKKNSDFQDAIYELKNKSMSLEKKRNDIVSLLEEKEKIISEKQKAIEDSSALLLEKESLAHSTMSEIDQLRQQTRILKEERDSLRIVQSSKDQELENYAKTMNEMQDKAALYRNRISDLEKENDFRQKTINDHIGKIHDMQMSIRTLLNERESMVQVMNRLKEKYEVSQKHAQSVKMRLEEEICKKTDVSKENALLAERLRHAHERIQLLEKTLLDKDRSFEDLQKKFDDFRVHVEDSKERDSLEIVGLKRDNATLHDEIKKANEKVVSDSGKLVSLAEEKQELYSTIERLKAELQSIKKELDTMHTVYDDLHSKLEYEVQVKEDIKKSKAIICQEKSALQDSLKTYVHSIEDMELLLAAEKERNKNLEKERGHLKKCLEISQRAFQVNKKMADLKIEEEPSI